MILCKLWFLRALIKKSNPLVVPVSVLHMAGSFCALFARGPWATFSIRFLLLVTVWVLCHLQYLLSIVYSWLFFTWHILISSRKSSTVHLPVVFLHFPDLLSVHYYLMFSCTVEFSPPSGVSSTFFVFQMEMFVLIFMCKAPLHWTESRHRSVCCRKFLKIGVKSVTCCHWLVMAV